MRIKLGRENIAKIACILLFLGFQDFIYINILPNYGSILTILFAFIGIIFFCLQRIKITKDTAICFALSFATLIYSCNTTESIRYFLIMISILMWREIYFKRLNLVIKSLVIEGCILSVMQILNGMIRIKGFSSSPTQFSCVIFLCLVYLLIWNLNNKHFTIDLYIIVCFLLIGLTETRTTILGSLAFIIFYGLSDIVEKSRVKNRKWMYVALGALIFIIASLNINYIIEVINSRLNRGNVALDNSNRTRMSLYTALISQWKNDAKMFLIGSGGGYVENFIKPLFNSSVYLPAHQDYLLIISEYGIIGLILFFYCFLKKHRAKLIFIAMFTVCSFHNILLSSRCMLLMFVILSDIDHNRLTVYMSKKE